MLMSIGSHIVTRDRPKGQSNQQIKQDITVGIPAEHPHSASTWLKTTLVLAARAPPITGSWGR